MTGIIEPHRSTQAALDHARQEHMWAINAAICEGTLNAELADDLAGFGNASRQLVEMLQWRDVAAHTEALV